MKSFAFISLLFFSNGFSLFATGFCCCMSLIDWVPIDFLFHLCGLFVCLNANVWFN